MFVLYTNKYKLVSFRQLAWRPITVRSLKTPSHEQKKTQPRRIASFKITDISVFLVAGVGFEPTTFRLWAWRATGLLHPAPSKLFRLTIKKAAQYLRNGISTNKQNWQVWYVIWKRVQKTRQRPTLPCLKTKYHRRCRVSRPSSEWNRVGHLRHNHLVIWTR